MATRRRALQVPTPRNPRSTGAGPAKSAGGTPEYRRTPKRVDYQIRLPREAEALHGECPKGLIAPGRFGSSARNVIHTASPSVVALKLR